MLEHQLFWLVALFKKIYILVATAPEMYTGCHGITLGNFLFENQALAKTMCSAEVKTKNLSLSQRHQSSILFINTGFT